MKYFKAAFTNHWNLLAFLGGAVTLENEADIGPDADGANNIVPNIDKPDEIVEELGNPLCDPATIAAKTEELNKLENQLNRDFIAALLKINDILDVARMDYREEPPALPESSHEALGRLLETYAAVSKKKIQEDWAQ